MTSLARDANRIAVIGGTSSVDGVTVVAPYVDPTTHRLLVDASGITLETNGIANGSQSLLNLVAGTNVTLSDNGTGSVTINSSAGTGTVTAVSVVSANGFAGSSSGGTTPALTISTTISGVLKGNGTAISAASAGTDYVAPGAITTSGLTMSTAKILGRATALTGAIEEIAVTGSGSVVLATSAVLTTPNLGTPSAITLTNGTGLPVSTGISGLGTGVATFLATPTSANLASAVTDETGSGALVFATSPTLVTPALGTPSALVGTNITGTATGLTSGITNALKSATTTVDVSAATAPSTGQVLTATDSTHATWQAAGGASFDPSTTANLFDEFLLGTTGVSGEYGFGWVQELLGGGGAIDHSAGTAGHPGQYVFVNGASNDVGVSLVSGQSGAARFGPMNQGFTIQTALKLARTTNVCVRFGFTNSSTTANPTAGIYMELDTGVNAGWRGCCRNASTSSYTASAGTASTNWVGLKVVSTGGTSIEFFVDGSSLGSVTTNIPSSNGWFFLEIITRSNSSTQLLADYMYLNMTGLTGR